MLENVEWLGHASFRITGEKVIYLDPWQLQSVQPADLILVTHGHRDHFSVADIERLRHEGTTLVTVPACAAQADASLHVVSLEAGRVATVLGVRIEAVAAYNIDKFRSPGEPFHPREAGGVGFVLTVAGTRIYHAGDTDLTPEMKQVRTDIALLPVSGRAVMTAEEAAEAAAALRPQVAVPMHYGAIMGTAEDALRFKELSPIRVEILSKSL